jgi:hypothetical protein
MLIEVAIVANVEFTHPESAATRMARGTARPQWHDCIHSECFEQDRLSKSAVVETLLRTGFYDVSLMQSCIEKTFNRIRT